MTGSVDDQEFLESLRTEFIDIALASLDECEQALLSFEESQDSAKLLEVKRQLHSLKGSARATDMESLATAFHELETKLEFCTKQDRLPKFVDLAFRFIDRTQEYLRAFKQGRDEKQLIDQVIQMVVTDSR